MIPLLFLLICCLSTHGQNLDFPDSNAVWSVFEQKYFVEGDSVLNGTVYQKYYLSNDSALATSSFFALVRKEPGTRRILAIPAGSTAVDEVTLYDFSLQTNDITSVHPLSFPPASEGIVVRVAGVDSVLILGDYHKRLRIVGVEQNTGFLEYWIEGIGSTFGVFNPGITGFVVFDYPYPTLLCYERNNEYLYRNPDYSSCYEKQDVGIDQLDAPKSISISPNPASDHIRISSALKIENYRIETMLGKVVATGELYSGSEVVEVGGLPAGIYVLRVRVEEEILSIKFVK
ncbi:MAG: T9SS type A sorting domain-containing protein [Bacteroidota bacterium]